MLFRTLFRDSRRPRPPRRGGRSYRPRLDVLEDRCLLSYSVIDIGTFGAWVLRRILPEVWSCDP